ncbi:MAG: hypothetical protein A2776_01225 [Candidatus Levybacteria bacterium RIFCSPHIGHO2_01_FULL_40_10]|nr:MAG: hypothetical protein A2776_01225 [Candidatus Levybacteria bacterium RIFCSPHIGHO2_01_FULL_40_10]
MKKIILVALVAAVVVALLFLITYKPNKDSTNSSSGKTYILELREEGYSPNEIKIKKGEIITFKTTLGKPFWPASDIHPTHGIYPEFDPGDAIMSDKTWSYKFNKVGKWRFHDHLAPYFTGTVLVEE